MQAEYCAPKSASPGCRRAPNTRKATLHIPLGRGVGRPGGVGDLWQARTHVARNPGGPASGLVTHCQVRTGNLRGTTVMDGCRESDSFRVPRKPSNQGRPMGPAEAVEGRELAKGNLGEHHRGRPQCRETLPQARDWVRQVLCTCASSPEAGARCGSAARRDLCGGRRVTDVPTATVYVNNSSFPNEVTKW